MNEHENNHTGSFIRRRQQELQRYLVSEMALQPSIAHLLLHLHKPTTLRDTIDLFVLNEDNLINHYFIPSEEPNQHQCKVCESAKEQHIPCDLNVQELSQEGTNSDLQVSFQEEEQLQGKRRICQICYIQCLEQDMVKIKGDVHSICLQCMEYYIKEEIDNMRVEKLTCPHCGQLLPSDLIQSLIDRPTYTKYRQFLRNLEIHKNPNLKWCPNSKCSVVVSTNPKKKTSKCPKCNTAICNRCNRQAHPKASCQGAFKKEIRDWENAKDVQKCKKCSGLVEKIAGCNHMTCSICHYEWCWLCGSEYSNAHFSPMNPFGCPGLMDRPRGDWTKCKIIALRVAILLLIIVGIPMGLPLAMLAVGPVMTIQVLYDCLYPEGCLKKTGVALLGIIIGLAGDPLVWIGCIFYFTPKGIIKLRNWHRQRRMEQQRRNTFLQERLLGQEIIEEPILQ